MPSDSGSAWPPSAPSTERRLSNSSDGSAGSGYSKATTDSADFLATRPHTAGVIPGKPAANPLQFVRVGPADLGSRAREQLRKAELAKRTEPSRIERQEDWQSNLDSWKSSRRKRVEHIIERCVEVRRMETEPSQPRAKAKTFNEILEERAGRRRRNPLALYTEDEGHDLSDLGIGTSSTKSSLSEDCDTHSLASDGIDLDKSHSDVDHHSNDINRKLGSSANEYDTCTTTTISSPEPEEYTYEGAIEGYKSRIISQTNSNIVKTVVNDNFKEKSPEKINRDIKKIRSAVSSRIEEKVSSFQSERSIDVKNNNIKKDLPKVDIHKRKEQFERENSQNSQIIKLKQPDIGNKKSIKERLSSLEKFTQETQLNKPKNEFNKLPAEITPIKERLSSLKKTKEEAEVNRLSDGDISSTKSLKERLYSLQSPSSEEDLKLIKTEIDEVSVSIKERITSLDGAKYKDIPKISIEDNIEVREHDEEPLVNKSEDKLIDSDLKSSLSCIENQMQSFCRSLDSLDINGQSSPNSFERIQSLEDFECSEMQNNIVPSDIETEDSGIHTARDSCAIADDFGDLTQVTSPVEEPMIEISEYDSSNEDTTPTVQRVETATTAKLCDTVHQNMTQYTIVEEAEQKDCQTENSDSSSNYHEAITHPEEISLTEDITELHMDREDEDTLKSLDNHDSSVSLNEPVSTASEGDTVVFEGKMTIHLNLNEIRNTISTSAGNSSNPSQVVATNDSSNNKSMPMVIDALELAFKELDSEDSGAMNISTENKEVTNQSITGPKAPDSGNSKPIAPLYENVLYPTGADAAAFLLDPPAALQPPKEKPPPPPIEDKSDDETLGNGNFKHTNSARRIKKEIRNKRTSFLGIEGQVDDSYLDVDLTLAPRPDITSFLQEETKIEKLLYKKTLSHDMDTKLRESKDSGVDVDRGHSAEAWYRAPSSPETSSAHSRQNSEPHTNVTVTPYEEEASNKLKEQTFNSNLASKLNDLSEVSSQSDDNKIDTLDKKIQQQQGCRTNEDWPDGQLDDTHTKEVLRFERELLQLEQEELRRQRENLIKDQTRIIQKSVQDVSTVHIVPEKPPLRCRSSETPNHNYRHSMPNLLMNDSYTPVASTNIDKPPFEENIKRKPFVSEEHIQRHFGVEESRKVLYDDRAKMGEVRRQVVPNMIKPPPPQPILPTKPRSRESIEREITMRSSRIPSAGEYMNVDRATVQLRQRPAQSISNGTNGQYHPMTRHTLQALSATPTPKLISNTDWMQSRNRKPANFNYNQHWLIQEAEQRRIEEQRNKIRNTQRHSYHQDMAPPTLHNLPQRHLSQEMKRPMRAEAPRPEPPREEKLLSVSGRRKCSHCGEELGRGAAMIIESLSLCYHVWCFTCAVCGARLGDGRAGADVRVRGRRLHCHHCYSGDDGRKYSCV